MDDHRIRLFLTVARAGGFTKAARELGVTQPSVSQNIGSLEKELGVTLFERSRSAVTLTPQGRIFMDYAERIDALYGEVSAVFSPAMHPKEQPVRIATTDFIATHILPSVLARMETLTGVSFSVATYPEDTDFQHLLTTPPPAGTLFNDRIADLAVALAPAPVSSAEFKPESIPAAGFATSSAPEAGFAVGSTPAAGTTPVGLFFTVLTAPRFSSKPFANLLQSLLL